MARLLRTRREVMSGLAAGGGLLAGGATLGLLDSGSALADAAKTDAQLLSELVAVELLSIAVLERVIASVHVRRRGRGLARAVLAQERGHLSAVREPLSSLGSPAVASRMGPQAIDQALSAHHVDRRLEDLHDEHDCLDLLLNLESIAEGAYYTAISQLHRPALVKLAAQILGNEAQHEALLGQLREPKNLDRAVPYAFVEGIH